MTYNEVLKIAKLGKTFKLPHFEGYFKWDYSINDLRFNNKDYTCLAKDLDILDRKDFYYII